MTDISKLLKIAVEASIYAGEEILKVYESDDFQIVSKADNSPLTLADKNAHNKIMSFLKKTEIPVLSEEGQHLPYKERKKWKCFWLVDPLDGTKEFIKRNGEFTVNIALIKKQIPVAGVIYVPVTKTLYFADIESGAFKIDEIPSKEYENMTELIKYAHKLPLPEKNRPYTVVGSRSHMNDETKTYFNKLKKEYGDIEIISRGSSLKLCMIAEGKADIYPRFGPTMEWDTAAGHAIVSAAGGTVTKINDTLLLYNKENLLNPFFKAKCNPVFFVDK